MAVRLPQQTIIESVSLSVKRKVPQSDEKTPAFDPIRSETWSISEHASAAATGARVFICNKTAGKGY